MTADLPALWRDRANELEPYAAPVATAFRSAAAELEAALRADGDETLTLANAAAASGYSERRLRELLAEGALPNAGGRGRPRIRRGDLPKRGPRKQLGSGNGYDAVRDAMNIIGKTG